MPPLVVHGFRNETDAELRYLNLHAPGVGFADYMRAIRDGRTLVYDQEPPPPEGTRPATEAVVGGEEFRAGGMTLLADIEEIAVADAWSDLAGPPRAARPRPSRRVVLRAQGRAGAHARWPRAPRGARARGSRCRRASRTPSRPLAPARFVNLHTPSCGFGSFLRALQDTGDEELAAASAGFDRQPAR